MIKIKGKATGELAVKRLWLPGLQEHVKCPNCGHETWNDLNGDHINYPMLGKWEEHGHYCSECGHEWVFDMKINITVDVRES